MMPVFLSLLVTLRRWARSRAALQLEVLALRHQLQVLQRAQPRRLRLSKTGRLLLGLLSRIWTGGGNALLVVKPGTVIPRHPRGVPPWGGRARPRPPRQAN